MHETHETFWKNEVKALQITVRDEDDNSKIEPDGAVYVVYNENGTEVVTEQVASVSSNQVSCLIGTAVTATPGNYYVIWTITKGQYTYVHRTAVEVEEWI